MQFKQKALDTATWDESFQITLTLDSGALFLNLYVLTFRYVNGVSRHKAGYLLLLKAKHRVSQFLTEMLQLTPGSRDHSSKRN